MNINEYSHVTEQGLWTNAFAEAMKTLTSQGGGILTVPAGQYITGPIQLQSNITLRLDSGAELLFTDDESQFPLVDTEFEGIAGKAYMPCIYARDAQNVSIVGSGRIDGSGAAWWQRQRDGLLSYPRPYLVCFQNCQNVRMDGITLRNSPCWTVHPLRCENVLLSGLMIWNPADSPNTDGINPNGCHTVHIEDCVIDVGDDCIAIKAGTEDTLRPHPCENITIKGCKMMHGHGGVVIGSEMSGGVKNVLVSDCVFIGTDRGIRLKTRRGRGSRIGRLYINDILMENVACPFVMNMYYHCGKDGKEPRVADKAAHPINAGTPQISEVSIKNTIVRGATACAGFLYGLPESPIRRVRIQDCTVTMAPGKPGIPAMMDGAEPMEAGGLFMRHCEEIEVIRGILENQTGSPLNIDESVDLTVVEGNL